MQNIKDYVKENLSELYRIVYDLCHIPAPSHREQKRAEYCKAWFERNGIPGAYIDEACNVILPYRAEGSDKLAVIEAHLDTVFPDTEPMPYVDDGEFIRCPGVGDDTASVAVLMLSAKYCFENRVNTRGALFVCNSCEEGLGNLKGTRYIFEKGYKDRITRLVSFDSSRFNYGAAACVGSHRYEVEVLTEGGHSWGKFGNKNAIAEISKIVNAIYSIELPKKEGKKVTYNVGTVSGGTSVNTIAQRATVLCEYRSDDAELLGFMKAEFEKIFESVRSDGVTVNVTLVGERPCEANVDPKKLDELKSISESIVFDTVGEHVTFGSSSTDCNIPMSLGIPAITVGTYIGYGTHTREEHIVKSSLEAGLEIGIGVTLKVIE